MFKSTWDKFLKTVSNDDNPSKRRRYMRRDQDVCAITIDGTTYPIKDWSMGGALIETPVKSYTEGQDITFDIKFKLRDRVLEVTHSGQIVRSSKTQMAIKFDPLPGEKRTEFDRVVEDANA